MYKNFILFASILFKIFPGQPLFSEMQSQVGATVFVFSNQSDKINSLPGLGAVKGIQMAGHLPVAAGKNPYKDGSNLFYWFVSSEGNVGEDPIVLWFNGGPGASGFYGFFAENGLYAVQNEEILVPRAFPWSKRVNYLILEQAPGIGFSYAAPDTHLANEAQAIDMLFHALKEFYKKYPELSKNPLFIAGESYAGKTIPLLASRILEQKTISGQPALNLQGILIGDGWVNPLVQLSSNADYAYSHGLIDLATRERVQKQYLMSAEEIRKQTPSTRRANEICNGIQKIILSKSGVSAENIRKLAEPNYFPITRYLNQKEVRETLHVDPRVKEVVLFNEQVSKDLEIGLQDSAAFLYPPLLANGIRVLIYNGLEDGKDCNFMGTDKWLAELEWSGKENLQKASTSIWKSITGDVAGYVREASGLTQVKIRGAGHLAPMDQPQNVQDMVYRFIFKEGFQ